MSTSRCDNDTKFKNEPDYNTYWDETFISFKKTSSKEYRKNRCLSFKNALGYNEYFIVKGQEFGVEDSEFEISDDASDGQIRNAFKKYSAGKKTNKNLMTKFGKAVAI